MSFFVRTQQYIPHVRIRAIHDHTYWVGFYHQDPTQSSIQESLKHPRHHYRSNLKHDYRADKGFALSRLTAPSIQTDREAFVWFINRKYWNVRYKKKTRKQDTVQISHFLQDALLHNHPEIDIRLKSSPGDIIRGRLTGVRAHTSDTPLNYIQRGGCYLELFLKPVSVCDKNRLNQVARTPQRIKCRFKIPFLPYAMFRYGRCSRFTGRFQPCPPELYTLNIPYRGERCRVFDLRKGSPNQRCDLDVGT